MPGKTRFYAVKYSENAKKSIAKVRSTAKICDKIMVCRVRYPAPVCRSRPRRLAVPLRFFARNNKYYMFFAVISI
jgi:hypothetical protein